jgi:hypothetical protein
MTQPIPLASKQAARQVTLRVEHGDDQSARFLCVKQPDAQQLIDIALGLAAHFHPLVDSDDIIIDIVGALHGKGPTTSIGIPLNDPQLLAEVTDALRDIHPPTTPTQWSTAHIDVVLKPNVRAANSFRTRTAIAPAALIK